VQNLWFVIPAIILGGIIIVKFVDWICIDSNSMSKTNPPYPIPKPKPKLGTFRIAPADTVNMFYVEEYRLYSDVYSSSNLGWKRVTNWIGGRYPYEVDKKFTEREAELYIKEQLDQLEAARIRNEALLEAARIRNEALKEFQSRNPPREVPPFHLLEDE